MIPFGSTNRLPDPPPPPPNESMTDGAWPACCGPEPRHSIVPWLLLICGLTAAVYLFVNSGCAGGPGSRSGTVEILPTVELSPELTAKLLELQNNIIGEMTAVKIQLDANTDATVAAFLDQSRQQGENVQRALFAKIDNSSSDKVVNRLLAAALAICALIPIAKGLAWLWPKRRERHGHMLSDGTPCVVPVDPIPQPPIHHH